MIERASRDQEKASGILTLYILSTSAGVHNMTFLKGIVGPPPQGTVNEVSNNGVKVLTSERVVFNELTFSGCTY